MGAFLVFIVEGVTKAHLVVVGKQGNAVVQDLCAGKGDLLAGERGCLHGVAVVKVQLQVFDEFVVVGNAPGFHLGGYKACFIHIEGQAGVFLQIQAGHQEIPQQLRAFHVHLQLVRGAFPRLRGFFQQGGDIPVNDQVGEVVEEAGRGGIAYVGAIQETGFQADTAHIVVGMGLHHNVAQFVPAGFAFQPDIAQAEVSQQVPGFRAQDVGRCLETDLGMRAVIQVQGVEVCVAQRGEETVYGILRIAGQIEGALEEEIQVGIGGDDAPVERVFVVHAHGRQV